jgi:SPP1 family predicted phage head-tail adaptor
MSAGILDRRITILRRTLTRNDHGEQVATYAELASAWGQKLDVTGREFFSAQRELAEGTARFRIRYRTDITLGLTDRLSVGGVEYDIVQIAEVGRQQWTDIVAVARKS